MNVSLSHVSAESTNDAVVRLSLRQRNIEPFESGVGVNGGVAIIDQSCIDGAGEKTNTAQITEGTVCLSRITLSPLCTRCLSRA